MFGKGLLLVAATRSPCSQSLGLAVLDAALPSGLLDLLLPLRRYLAGAKALTDLGPREDLAVLPSALDLGARPA